MNANSTDSVLIAATALMLAVALAAAEAERPENSPAPRRALPQAAPPAPSPAATSPAPTPPPILPPCPEGVADLKFAEIYEMPVGPKGLVFSEKIRSLDGARVRMLGYMVRQSQPVPHCLLLSPIPLTLHEHEYGFADDLPFTVVHVFTQTNTPAQVRFTPGLMLLTGTLRIGNRPEPDGRISMVRLQLDAPAHAAPESAASVEADAAAHSH